MGYSQLKSTLHQQIAATNKLQNITEYNVIKDFCLQGQEQNETYFYDVWIPVQYNVSM